MGTEAAIIVGGATLESKQRQWSISNENVHGSGEECNNRHTAGQLLPRSLSILELPPCHTVWDCHASCLSEAHGLNETAEQLSFGGAR